MERQTQTDNPSLLSTYPACGWIQIFLSDPDCAMSVGQAQLQCTISEITLTEQYWQDAELSASELQEIEKRYLNICTAGFFKIYMKNTSYARFLYLLYCLFLLYLFCLFFSCLHSIALLFFLSFSFFQLHYYLLVLYSWQENIYQQNRRRLIIDEFGILTTIQSQ